MSVPEFLHPSLEEYCNVLRSDRRFLQFKCPFVLSMSMNPGCHHFYDLKNNIIWSWKCERVFDGSHTMPKIWFSVEAYSIDYAKAAMEIWIGDHFVQSEFVRKDNRWIYSFSVQLELRFRFDQSTLCSTPYTWKSQEDE